MYQILPFFPNLFFILLQIDIEQAEQCKKAGCPLCRGTLHCANYPRVPLGCPEEFLASYSWRFSFDCADCRKRVTPASVRFLGRRHYLALAVILVSAARVETTSKIQSFSSDVGVSVSTILRWKEWWINQFPQKALWRATCARFLPPVDLNQLPSSLVVRFGGFVEDAL